MILINLTDEVIQEIGMWFFVCGGTLLCYTMIGYWLFIKPKEERESFQNFIKYSNPSQEQINEYVRRVFK